MDKGSATQLRDLLVDQHFRPGSVIVNNAAKRFKVTPHAIRYHLRKLLAEGVLIAEGNTKARRYQLPRSTLAEGTIEIDPSTEDDLVWREHIRPALEAACAAQPVIAAMRHGSTEMVNNVLDHSGAEQIKFSLTADPRSFLLVISDGGVGIFEKIKHDCNLYDRRQALLELSKGKLTSDPTKHTGEGIFFTSRIFDRFYIVSLDLSFIRLRDGENWLLDTKNTEADYMGTEVAMEIKRDTDVDIPSVFKRFEDDDARFSKTHVPVYLAKFGDEELVSRSQARRLMARVEKFSEVILDFDGVASIGQAFSDEVFRVWSKEHPETSLVSHNANVDVRRMIQRAKAQGQT